MLEKWKISLDKGGYVGAMLTDLPKAFGTVDHDLLIAKLYAYGLDKGGLKLVKSCLTNRWQRTKMNNVFSSWSELIIGVPQGSVLGSLFFNIFINDLFFIVLETDIGNSLHTSDISLGVLLKKLEYATEKTIDWLEYNGMKLNSSKTPPISM